MKVDVIKTSFVGGEFGESLWGRTDIAQYAYACEVAENFLIRPFGSIISASGTRFINEVKDSDKRTRVIPFIFSRNDAYIIEVGDKYFRFYTDGGVVLDGASAYELAHDYSEDEVFDIQFSQIKDVIYITHPNHITKKLIRYGATNWTITNCEFLGGPFLDDNTSAITITPSATSGNITITLSATSSTIFFVPTSGTSQGHVGALWKIAGEVSDVQGYVKITACSSSTVASATVVKTLSASDATTDWAEGAWSDYRGYPASCVFFESRLFLARTDFEPQKVWGSVNFNYEDFTVGADDGALNLPLTSNESNEILWIASGNNLIAGTFGGEFVISATNDGPLTPSTTRAKKVAAWGSAKIIPKRIGNFFYHIQRFGEKIRELFYFWDLDTYKSVDKTILSPHILKSSVIDMTYQQNPDTILWCVLSNGTLATMTREVDQEVQGWTRHNTDGLYESISSIPSEHYPYDELWVVVNRTIDGVTKRYIELFESIELPDRQDKFLYLHSALSYDAFNANTSAVISISATTGTIALTTSTTYFTEESVGRRIRAIDDDGNTLGECSITGYTSGTIVIGTTTTNFSALTYPALKWGVSVEELSGLDHLEDKEIAIYADGGFDKPDKTVESGEVELAYDYFVISAGLRYTQKIVTLPFEAGSQRGTAQGKKQKISQIGFKLRRSFVGFLTGGSDEYLRQFSFRNPATPLGTPEEVTTGLVTNINFNDDYQYGSKVYIVNDEPMPIELLNIICTLNTYDK